MSQPAQLLHRLRARGVVVEVNGDGLHVEGELTRPEVDQLRRHKPELLALLAPPVPATEDQRSGAPAATPHRVTRTVRHRASQDVLDQVAADPAQPKPKPTRQRGPNGQWQSDQATAGYTSATTAGDAVDDEDEDDSSPPPRRSFWDRLLYGDAS